MRLTPQKIARLRLLPVAGFLLLAGLLFPSPTVQAEVKRFNLGPPLEEEPTPTAAPTPDQAIHFDQDRWNEMRRSLEGEEIEEAPPPVAVSTGTAVAEPPKPPPGLIQVDLPYESSLSVTGRKVIKLAITNTHISKERADELGTRQDSQEFTMEQELQARIQGTVARKTTINVNFDDTKDNVKDFSVIYKGDPDEVVQEAAFGDIVLSLPATEFVNYNKQLFGIRTSLRYKKLGFMAIGSRTKGTTETKRFTGTTTRQQVFVNDTAYIRHRFYDLTFTTAPAIASLVNGRVLPMNGTIPEDVFVEDTTGLPNPGTTTYAIATPTAPADVPIQIPMRLLSPGVDYSIDRLRGIITFTNAIPDTERVAIDFTLNDGTTRLRSLTNGARAVLIKDRLPENPGVSQEIKRFYSAGARNIVPDNGLGNFALRLMDKNHETEIGSSLSPPQHYPDTIDMKFDTGIFEVKSPLPFPDVYASNVNTGSPVQSVFELEYNSILRTYQLRPNIVLQSETVEVNGRKVTRDLDYFIDYDIGVITFFNEDLIRESTVIDVKYEYAPFGGQLGETLVGARATYDLFQNHKTDLWGVDNWSLGSTVLYNFAAKPTAPPDVRSTPQSLLVTEGDSIVNGLKFGSLPITTKMTMEAARSQEQPNLYGKALIDSMEGIKQDDAAPLLKDAWQPAANPQVSGTNAVDDFRGRDNGDSHIRWDDSDTPTSDPNDGGATQKSLDIGFTLNSTSSQQEQVSIIHAISIAGRDFSKKTSIEVELEGAGAAGSGVEMFVEYGTFNEDADGDGKLDTEDRPPFDKVLSLGEDIGWDFNNPVTGIAYPVGANNERLDSEDLDGDGALNRVDFPATFDPLFALSSSTGRGYDGQVVGSSATVFTADLGFTGRRSFKVPIDLVTAEEQSRMTSVKQVRITLRRVTPGQSVGTVKLVRLSVVGNTYEPATVFGTGGSTMTVRAINNKDDNNYYSLIGNGDYDDLYGDAKPDNTAKEQALDLHFLLEPGSSATTRATYSFPRDFSRHSEFRFFITKPLNPSCGSNCGGKVFMQVGSETEYQQATIDLASLNAGIWQMITIKQVDLDGDGIADQWQSSDPRVVITKVGQAPSLAQVAQLKIGVLNDTASNIDHEVWINEIHLAQPTQRTGHAKRYAVDSVWSGWGDFGGSYRLVDRNWETPTTAVTNQDNEQSQGYFNLSRVSFMPMTFRATDEVTKTPSAFRSNQNALVSFFEEGQVRHTTKASTAKLIVPKLPVLDFSYTDDGQKNSVTQRNEVTDAVNLGATYSPTANLDLLPGRLQLRPLPTSITLLHSIRRTTLRFADGASNPMQTLLDNGISTAPYTSTNLNQYSTEDEARLAFKPWNGFTFNPNYKIRVDTEKRFFRDDEKDVLGAAADLNRRETPRSMAQDASASGDLRLLKWLDPRYTFSYTGSETNDIPTQTDTTAYMQKSITRNSQGEVSAAIQASQILPAFKPVASLNFNGGYKIENGDNYTGMPEGFKWRNKLWVGTPLNVATGTVAQLTQATDRRTTRLNTAWQPFSAYRMDAPRLKPFKSLSLTSNFLRSIEQDQTTGTTQHIVSSTWPDLILTVSDLEKLFSIKRGIDASRLVVRDNTRKTETTGVTRGRTDTYGSDFQFQFLKKLDVATTFNLSHAREDNLVTHQINSKTDTLGYSVQTRFPWRVWAFTPRYEYDKSTTRDAIQLTNDLTENIYSLQIYGDVSKPLGIRFGHKEIGLANRIIVNSTIKWDSKRSVTNPETNYLDVYSASVSGDYTISQNFRMAIGADFSDEVHHPQFRKLDQLTFGLNTTLTIQF